MMLNVARLGGDGAPVSLASVARQANLSHGYLEQLALPLRTARLLRGVSGKGGGYQLARPASAITVREIVEAVLGPIAIVECVESASACLRSEYCECRPMYVLINRKIVEALSSFTLADLVRPQGIKKRVEEIEAAAVDDAELRLGCPERVAPNRS
jgi:Rrf2 family protein